MPTSAAYARTLLHKRRAQRIPHPAFNIIQLTSVVAEPVLRPVVVNIFLHQQTAYLTLLTEHLRGTISSLSMIVDLTKSNHTQQSRRTRLRRQQHSGLYDSMLLLRQQIFRLMTLLATLQTIIPISHLSVLSVPSTNKASLRIIDYAEVCLKRYLVPLNAPITLVRPGDLQVMLSPELSQAVQRAGTETETQLPDLIAYAPETPQLRSRFSPHTRVKDVSPQSDQLVANQNQSFNDIQPGQVCTFWYLGRKRAGFVSAIQQDVLIVRIAITATLQGIRWRKVRLRTHQVRDRWPASSIVILPLIPISTTPDSV
jgi:hypothetical protein